MALFMNKKDNPKLYKNNCNISAPNQDYYQTNYMADMVAEQKKVNQSLQQSLDHLKKLYASQKYFHASQWTTVSKKLHELQEWHRDREHFEKNIDHKLTLLNRKGAVLQNTFEKEMGEHQEIKAGINKLHTSNEHIISQLKEHETVHAKLAVTIDDVHHMQQQVTKSVNNQEKNYQDIASQMENQAALLEKIVRQVDYLKSVLYERASYLAEKVEDGYNLTSAYVYKLFKGDEHPMTLYMEKRKKS